jgi:hypothetical protein
MPRDIIGLRAEIKEQLDEALEVEAAIREALEDATRNREKLEDFLSIVDNHRGADRRNAPRVYNAPGVDSKAAEVERTVVGILEVNGPLRSDQILTGMLEMERGDLLPGEARSDKLARLAVYLTRMHRRSDAPLAYDRDSRVYSLKGGA